MTFIERRLYFHLDWLLLAAVLAICAIGITMIYSATQSTTPRLYVTQLYALALGLIAMLVALTIDYRTLADKSHWIYVAVARACCSTCCSSASCAAARGAGSPLGFFNLQPSEFAKVARGAGAREVLRREPARRSRRAPTC